MPPTQDETMEFDQLSGRTLPKHDPWRQILRNRHARKHALPTPPSKENQAPPNTTPRLPPAPRLPANDYKVIMRPRSGLRVSAWATDQLTHSIQLASNIPASRFYAEVIVQPQVQSNIIAASSPSEDIVEALRNITSLQLGTATYEVAAYMKPPPGTARGVIQGINPGTPSDELRRAVYSTGPPILDIRMLGTSNAAVITFDGPHVPFYVRAYSTLTRCRPYRNTYQCCVLCGELGHRQDICPNPHAVICPNCHIRDPTPHHECKPQCKLCGLDHITASKDCKRKLKSIRLAPTPAATHPRTPLPPPPADFPPLRQEDAPKVSWSAIAASPSTAVAHPPIQTHTIDTPELLSLRNENARLKAQLDTQQAQIDALQKQIQQLTTHTSNPAALTEPPPQPTTPHSSSTPCQEDTMTAASQEDTTTPLALPPSLIAQITNQINTAITTTQENLKSFLKEALAVLHTRLDHLEERCNHFELTKRKTHKKPKQQPMQQSVETVPQPTWDDGDSSELST